MRLLALDQSSHITGYAVFEDSKLIQSGVFSLKSADLGERLYAYRKKIIELVDIFNINQVAFEDIQFQQQVNGITTYRILAEIIGITEELLTELKIPYQIVNSNTWKSKLKIKGKARADQKRNCQQWVLDTYGKKVSQDQADAIALGASLYIEEKKSSYSWE